MQRPPPVDDDVSPVRSRSFQQAMVFDPGANALGVVNPDAAEGVAGHGQAVTLAAAVRTLRLLSARRARESLGAGDDGAVRFRSHRP